MRLTRVGQQPPVALQQNLTFGGLGSGQHRAWLRQLGLDPDDGNSQSRVLQ